VQLAGNGGEDTVNEHKPMYQQEKQKQATSFPGAIANFTLYYKSSR
jgi:hypothetical protein